MFRFTIRDVLWLTVVVAMALGWSMNAVHSTAQKRELARLRGNYEAVKATAHELYGWNVQEHGDNGISIVWPNSPPQSGQVARQANEK